ncbi:MAG: hypothetical protein KIT69_13060 [Propionibacteriaceae bacterium]|nr:hypothetical protein [Propionibacteriaceae bacterium]
MTTPPSGWPSPSYPPPQGEPIPPAPPFQGVPGYPPPQGDPAYALVEGPAYPPPQGNPPYPPGTGWSPPPPQPGWPAATGQPAQGWMPAPLGGNTATWAPPGWPPPTALPPAASPVPMSGQVAFPPPGYPPAPAPRRSAWLAVAIVICVLAAVGVIAALVAQQWNPTSPEVDQPTIEVTGGDIGTPVDLTGPDGSGRVTVTRARWTAEGEVAPEPGTSYLIVDVRVEGVSGELTTGAVFTTVVTTDGQRHGISYGPVLDPLLTSRVLRAGETNTGHLGYQLAPGPVQLEFQTSDGVPLGSVEIPGP